VSISCFQKIHFENLIFEIFEIFENLKIFKDEVCINIKYKMSSKRESAFQVIKDFIFVTKQIMKKHKSVALWNRFLERDNSSGVDDLSKEKVKNKTIRSFEAFLNSNKKYIHSDVLHFPVDTKIKYNSHIFVDLPILIEMSDDDDLDIIKQYLLTLDALLCNDETSLKLLESSIPSPSNTLNTLGVDSDTPEGEFINDILGKLTGVVGEDDMQNPQMAIMKLMNSGILNDVTNGAKEKIQGGSMSLSGLMNTLQTIVTKLEDPLIEESPPSHSQNGVEEVEVNEVELLKEN